MTRGGITKRRGQAAGPRLLSLVAILGLGCTAPAQTTQPALHWRRLPDMPVGVFDAAATTRGGKAVVTGGISQAGATEPVVQVLDLGAMTWSLAAALSTGRCFHAQVTLADGRVLVAGGQTGQLPGKLAPTASCELIDLQRDKVELLPALPRPAGHPTAHRLPDGQAIVIGGSSASLFDPVQGAWVRHIGLRESRESHASVLLPDGRVLVAGGVGRGSLELVETAAGVSVLLAAKLPHALDDLRAVALDDGRIWLLGGQDSGSGATTDRTWLVDVSDPVRARISDGPRLGIEGGVADMCLIRVGGAIIVCGGESEQHGRDTELSSARRLDPRSLRVAALPDLAEPHDDAVAVATERAVIVLGGYRVQSTGLARVPRLPYFPMPTASRTVEMLEIVPAGRW